MEQEEKDAAYSYLKAVGLDPTPDAVEQLSGPFLAALTIMCKRGYNRDGETWRSAGWGPQLYELMKKVARIRFHVWRGRDMQGALKEIPDIINYAGFLQRGIATGIPKWGEEWGEPCPEREEEPIEAAIVHMKVILGIED